MICPKCDSPMAHVTIETVEVDRCSRCGGLWFDLLELEEVRGLDKAASLDTGDTARGRWYDVREAVRCPRDGTRMLRMADASQPHVWFESCPVCHGTYLDAGELKDLAELTWLERLVRRGRSRPT